MEKLLIIIIFFLIFLTKQSSSQVVDRECPLDTVKGILYRSYEYGNSIAEEGYYIGYCKGYQVGWTIHVDSNWKLIFNSKHVWIPSIILVNNTTDGYGNLKSNKCEGIRQNGYFTDKDFKKVEPTSVYGLLVEKIRKL